MCAAVNISKQRANNLFSLQDKEAVYLLVHLFLIHFQHPGLLKSERNSEDYEDNYRVDNKRNRTFECCLQGINT